MYLALVYPYDTKGCIIFNGVISYLGICTFAPEARQECHMGDWNRTSRTIDGFATLLTVGAALRNSAGNTGRYHAVFRNKNLDK
jgi:hypothetical protein